MVIGEIGAYDPKVEEWPNYVERLEGYFDANGITDGGKKRSVFIAVVGPRSYNLQSTAKFSRTCETERQDLGRTAGGAG